MKNQNMDFILVKNPLTKDGNYFARCINQKGISFEDLLTEMEKNTAIRKQDLRLSITQFANAILDNVHIVLG